MHSLEDSFLQLISEQGFHLASVAPINQVPMFLPSILSADDFASATQYMLSSENLDEDSSFEMYGSISSFVTFSTWKDSPSYLSLISFTKKEPHYVGSEAIPKRQCKDVTKPLAVYPRKPIGDLKTAQSGPSLVPHTSFDSNDVSWMDQLAQYSELEHDAYFSIIRRLHKSLADLHVDESMQITLCRRLLDFLQKCNVIIDADPIIILASLSMKSTDCCSMIMEDSSLAASKSDNRGYIYCNSTFKCWLSVFILESIKLNKVSDGTPLDTIFSFEDGSRFVDCLADIISDTESILSIYKVLKDVNILLALQQLLRIFISDLMAKPKADQKIKLLDSIGPTFRIIRSFCCEGNVGSEPCVEVKTLLHLSDKFIASLICNFKDSSATLRYKSLKVLSQSISLQDPLSSKETYARTLCKMSNDSSSQVRQCLLEYLFLLREIHWNEFTSCFSKMVGDKSAVVQRQLSKISTTIFHKLEDPDKQLQILSMLLKGAWDQNLAMILSKEWLIPAMKSIASAKDLNMALRSFHSQLLFLLMDASFQHIIDVFSIGQSHPSFERRFMQDLGGISLAALSDDVPEKEKLAMLQIVSISCEFGLSFSNLVYTLMMNFLQDRNPLVVEQALTVLSLCSCQLVGRQSAKLNELIDILLSLISRGSETLISKSVSLLLEISSGKESVKKKVLNYHKKIIHIASKMEGEYTLLCRCLYASSLILAKSIRVGWLKFEDSRLHAELIMTFRSKFGSIVEKCCISSLCALMEVHGDLLNEPEVFQYISRALVNDPLSSTHMINLLVTLSSKENSVDSSFELTPQVAHLYSNTIQSLSRLYESTFESLKTLWPEQSFCMAMSIFSRKVILEGDIPPTKPLIFLALMLCSPWCETRIFSKSFLEDHMAKNGVNLIVGNLAYILPMSSEQYYHPSISDNQGLWNDGLEEGQSYYQLLYDMIKTKAVKREFLASFCRVLFSNLDLKLKIFLLEEFSFLHPKSQDDTQLLCRYIEEYLTMSDDEECGQFSQYLSLLQRHLKSGSKKKLLIRSNHKFECE